MTYLPVIDFRRKKYQALRKAVYERDNYTCCVCGARPDYIPCDYDGRYTLWVRDRVLEIDHIRPRIFGGDHSMKNLRTICSSCNSRKAQTERKGRWGCGLDREPSGIS
ncbi:HNH endonuclease [Desulfotomaculum copahuensis]|uniref:HNH endonuclease n=1 Tax=Desulfotomaculum copahuensis TaxID=1838280 RepID=UPI00098FA3D1